ncbi:MAG: sensor histidine kinase [Anaerolineales bacterium]|nr:MAG: sensor histidine kinase [Anaerolineales bacterium]
MSSTLIPYIFFFYGLAFFSMGMGILVEIGHGTDPRLAHALRPLAAFGLIHGIHEWLEMFEKLGILPFQQEAHILWNAFRLIILAFSFLSLGAFGSSLLSRDDWQRRISLLLPLSLTAIWGFGLLIMKGRYAFDPLINVMDVWTRYILAVPSAMFACAGLITQQRRFRQAGLAQFGRDSLWAAIAFFWYGIVGQTFTRNSLLPPSTVINQDLFIELFGFPIQLLRAASAVVAAVFVMRFLRSFEVETKRRIAALQAERVEEAERREALRGELLRRVVQAQESERQRIARELHDETGQALTAIGLGLRGIGTAINQDAEKATQNIRQLEGLVTHSLTELQRLIADLRPSHLDDLGLAATLRWFAGEVQSRTPLRVNFEVIGHTSELPSEVRTALFRIAQEALTNSVKHAAADNASLRLIYSNRKVTLQVSDDGCGFDMQVHNLAQRSSWGLEGMRERANLLGGTFQIMSSVGSGTMVEVTIPYVNTDNSKEKTNEDTLTTG